MYLLLYVFIVCHYIIIAQLLDTSCSFCACKIVLSFIIIQNRSYLYTAIPGFHYRTSLSAPTIDSVAGVAVH